MSVLEQDVSDQVHDVPVAGHIGDVHLVLNFDYEVPSSREVAVRDLMWTLMIGMM